MKRGYRNPAPFQTREEWEKALKAQATAMDMICEGRRGWWNSQVRMYIEEYRALEAERKEYPKK